jgi:hypothetical protein
MEIKFLKEALFSGMTSNAFKLGTVLSLGWFWMRRRGCIVLFRGETLSSIDVQNILGVFEPDTEEICPAVYLEHRANETYFYLVCRVNICGYCQWGVQAVARVTIDSEGGLLKAQPNGILGLNANRTEDRKVKLCWYYCPAEQEIEPVSFKVYADDGTGRIDYDNAVSVIKYKGRGFYSYTSDELSEGRKDFAVKAVSAEGIEGSVSIVEMEACLQAVESPIIYKAEAF